MPRPDPKQKFSEPIKPRAMGHWLLLQPDLAKEVVDPVNVLVLIGSPNPRCLHVLVKLAGAGELGLKCKLVGLGCGIDAPLKWCAHGMKHDRRPARLRAAS